MAIPVPGWATVPSAWPACLGLRVGGLSGAEHSAIASRMSLRRGDVADAAVPMIVVVPTHEVSCPGPSRVEVGEALGRELGPVLRGAEQRLGIGVVVAHARPRVRRLDAQPVQHRQHRGGLERGAVVAVQHGLGQHRGDALGQRRAAHQVRGVIGVVGVVHLPADDLAAVQVQDQVQVEPPADHRGRQIGHVPAPHLARRRGDVRGRRSHGAGPWRGRGARPARARAARG